MGKRIISQARGKGSPTYRIPKHSFNPKLEYKRKEGKVVDLVTGGNIQAPIAEVEYADKSRGYIIAPEGIAVGDDISKIIMTLSEIPEGTKIFSIEKYPNSGPMICRAPGSAATIISKSSKECILMMPSRKIMKLNPMCMATLGIPAGEGRKEKPWVKAGKKWIAMHARGKLYPRTSATKMNAVDHPLGGSGHGKMRPPVSRNAPPGRRVGKIAPRRTGRKK